MRTTPSRQLHSLPNNYSSTRSLIPRRFLLDHREQAGNIQQRDLYLEWCVVPSLRALNSNQDAESASHNEVAESFTLQVDIHPR